MQPQRSCVHSCTLSPSIRTSSRATASNKQRGRVKRRTHGSMDDSYGRAQEPNRGSLPPNPHTAAHQVVHRSRLEPRSLSSLDMMGGRHHGSRSSYEGIETRQRHKRREGQEAKGTHGSGPCNMDNDPTTTHHRLKEAANTREEHENA